MDIITELFAECKNRSLHCSLSYQRINDYSVEIYTGYKSSYHLVFYTDGHIELEEACKVALDKILKIKIIVNFDMQKKLEGLHEFEPRDNFSGICKYCHKGKLFHF